MYQNYIREDKDVYHCILYFVKFDISYPIMLDYYVFSVKYSSASALRAVSIIKTNNGEVLSLGCKVLISLTKLLNDYVS